MGGVVGLEDGASDDDVGGAGGSGLGGGHDAFLFVGVGSEGADAWGDEEGVGAEFCSEYG